MRDSLYLALQYLKYYKWRSLLLIVSIGLITFLPFGLKRLIVESETQLMLRADSTPLIIGAKGSASDLVLNTLYFRQERSETISMEAVDKIDNTGLGYSIPVYSAFKARQYSIIGIDLSYFEFRDLQFQEGRPFGVIGECVIGSEVANQLGLGAGDEIISSPENYFDFAGVYPLKMTIVGVLAGSNSPDDQAVFTDLKTTWVIQGLGHGHEDLEQVTDPSLLLDTPDSTIAATSKLKIYQEITDENRNSIHFHGDPAQYPISAIIFIPNDQKSGTLLRGKFAAGDFAEQILVPSRVIAALLQSIFRIKQVFDLMFLLVGLATLLIFLLVIGLSLRLRKGEIKTLYTLGSSKGKVVQIIGLEIVTVLVLSGTVAIVLYSITGFFVEAFINRFILG